MITIERFIIKQDLISTTISGYSIFQGKTTHTTWEGNLFKKEGKTFKFVIGIDTDPYEYGILTIQFIDNNFLGIYNSGNPNDAKVIYTHGQKTDKKWLLDQTTNI